MAEEEAKPIEKADSGPRRGRVIVYQGGPSASLNILGQHKPHTVDKSDVNPAVADVHDAFINFQTVPGSRDQLLAPPFDFDVVADLVSKNSILPPLIDAMVVNIDGTGAEIIVNEKLVDEEKEVDEKTEKKEKAAIQEYFDEPFPGQSFLTQRRQMRYEQESIGNAYLEVMRNAKKEVVFWKPIVPAKNIRLVRLDDAVDVTKTVKRNGTDQSVVVSMRERRYVQALGKNIVWFKDFGASRDLDKKTGKWAPLGTLKFEDRANEIIHYTLKSDPFSPYGLPRWWSNAPSVIGSRRAEEFNLMFFDSGGIPPMMVIVSGGALAVEAEKALRDHFMATGPNRHAAIVLEAYGTGGDIDKPSNVKIQIERFGSERQNDSFFENYIERCDHRVQRSFRIPSQFLGMSDDFTFATALSSMMVVEAQVFASERAEFDEHINLKLMPELPNGAKYIYRSKVLSLADAEKQLSGLTLIKTLLPPKMLVERVGEVVGWPDLTLSEEEVQEIEDRRQAEVDAKNRASVSQPQDFKGPEDEKDGKGKGKKKKPPVDAKGKPIKKYDFMPGVISLAADMAEVLQIGFARPEEAQAFQKLRQ
ncbi:MAG: hypothetical protein IH897_14245, partial [Planctomycetes bacterium]|nr:hypothetical protein [Planctomycetota bacterium]